MSVCVGGGGQKGSLILTAWPYLREISVFFGISIRFSNKKNNNLEDVLNNI